MDHVFGSRWLIDELRQLGFSISYDEFGRYKQVFYATGQHRRCVSSDGPNVHTVGRRQCRSQYSNPWNGGDRNVFGKESFVESTCCSKSQRKVAQMVVDKGIPIHQYIGPPRQSLSNVVFEPILTLQFPHISPPAVYYSNVLWQFLNRSNDKMPNLSGFMQHVFRTQLTFDSVVDHLYKCTVSMPGTNGSHRYRFSLVTGFS